MDEEQLDSLVFQRIVDLIDFFNLQLGRFDMLGDLGIGVDFLFKLQ